MASVEYQQDPDDNGQRTAVQGVRVPAAQAPTPAQPPTDLRQRIASVGMGDLNPLATETGMSRDALSDLRDQYNREQLSAFRSTAGFHVAEDDLGALAQLSASQNGQPIPGTSGALGAGRDAYQIAAPGFQFTDPYTRQLEDVARQQMTNLSQPQSNPALEKFLGFLNSRFDTLTQTPGYSPDDLALLRTQALDPIEQDRAASQRRATERAARAGFLPTSGITQLTGAPNGGTETLDQTYDRMRAAAQRDLAINAITKRNADLNQAMGVGSLMGVQIPQAQRSEDQTRRSELLNLAQLLYNLPRQAQQDALSVINGSPSSMDLFQQAVQTQQQQRLQQQQDAQKWASIGQLIAQMVF